MARVRALTDLGVHDHQVRVLDQKPGHPLADFFSLRSERRREDLEAVIHALHRAPKPPAALSR